jgi:hypothetical protein
MSPYELPKTAFLNFAPVSFETGCLLVLPENNKDLLPSSQDCQMDMLWPH